MSAADCREISQEKLDALDMAPEAFKFDFAGATNPACSPRRRSRWNGNVRDDLVKQQMKGN